MVEFYFRIYKKRYLYLPIKHRLARKPDTWVEVSSDRIDLRFSLSNHDPQDGIGILYDLHFYILIYKEKLNLKYIINQTYYARKS